MLDVVHLAREEWRLEDLVDLHVAHAGCRTHLVAQVALVATGVTHHGLHDLNADLEGRNKYVKDQLPSSVQNVTYESRSTFDCGFLPLSHFLDSNTELSNNVQNCIKYLLLTLS